MYTMASYRWLSPGLFIILLIDNSHLGTIWFMRVGMLIIVLTGKVTNAGLISCPRSWPLASRIRLSRSLTGAALT
ncbi:hypothetical protein F4808DRAFT_236336 [Astrocystis sublimbata]|nr:hypothetical protein F4808DRAFT_236336 [Astrocystis sublimbata]